MEASQVMIADHRRSLPPQTLCNPILAVAKEIPAPPLSNSAAFDVAVAEAPEPLADALAACSVRTVAEADTTYPRGTEGHPPSPHEPDTVLSEQDAMPSKPPLAAPEVSSGASPVATPEKAAPEEAAEAQPEARTGAVAAPDGEQAALRAALQAVMRLMLHGNSRPVHRPLLAAFAKLPPAWLAVAGADISTMVSPSCFRVPALF